MGVKVETLIIQMSRENDRSDKEKELAAQGLIPLIAFANGPEHAYLLGARPEDLAESFAVAHNLAEGLGAERLAIRMRVFNALAYAIETDMKFQVEETDFPNDVLLMFVDALVQYGIESPDVMVPCAVLWRATDLEDPDYEEAPDADGADPDEPPAIGHA
jgi:hypothetical protein